MSLSSNQLDAFLAVCREHGFSKAAQRLHITQSALSQRVAALESQLEQSLLVRDRAGVRLTEAGERLLRYCQAREALESEALSALQAGEGAAMAGTVRVAGFSSVVRSVLMPCLAPLLRDHPRIRLEMFSREVTELPQLLLRGEAEYVVLDKIWERAGVEHLELGRESNVLVESSRYKSRHHFLLDHDADDSTSEKYFRGQKPSIPLPMRCYLDDVYGILDGVEMGLGRAVVSKHLIKKEMQIRIVRDLPAMKNPVVLHYLTQPYYTRTHQIVIETLSRRAKTYLK